MAFRKILETLALAQKGEKKAAGSSEWFYLALLWLVGGHSGCVRTICGEDSIQFSLLRQTVVQQTER